MKTLFYQYRPFLLFLSKFFLSYLILTLFYRLYLSIFIDKLDYITTNVSYSTKKILNFFGQQTSIVEDVGSKQYQLYLNGKYLARIIEGCNSMSVIILFIAFVIAFKGKFRHTVIFIFLGSMLIYLLNILRIALLVILVNNYPTQEPFLHGVLFPSIIYGVVFLLWLYWVKNSQ